MNSTTTDDSTEPNSDYSYFMIWEIDSKYTKHDLSALLHIYRIGKLDKAVFTQSEIRPQLNDVYIKIQLFNSTQSTEIQSKFVTHGHYKFKMSKNENWLLICDIPYLVDAF
jgi:hypothetical protein